jgi:hypothetical protein
MPKGLLLVFSNAKDAADSDAFSRWYDEVHIPDVLKIDGFVAATRYQIDESMREVSPLAPFLAVYEVDADPLTSVLSALQEAATLGAMRTTELAQRDPPSTVLLFQPIADRRMRNER